MARVFYIGNPIDGKNQRIYYNKSQDKVKLLEKVILNHWSEYCNNHWIWLYKFEDGKHNYEDKVKRFLARCGTFLIVDDFKNSSTLTGEAIGKIKSNELSLDGDWSNDEIEVELEETTKFLNKYVKDKFSNDGKLLTTGYENEIVNKNKKTKSRTSRMTNIYSEEEKEVEDYERIHISNTFNIWKKATKVIPARKGMIDKSKPYISKWCAVDTENIFIFQDKKHKISEDVSQYSIRTKKPRYDDYKPDYQMDQILVYEQEGELFFFDQDIQQLEDNKITDLT